MVRKKFKIGDHAKTGLTIALIMLSGSACSTPPKRPYVTFIPRNQEEVPYDAPYSSLEEHYVYRWPKPQDHRPVVLWDYLDDMGDTLQAASECPEYEHFELLAQGQLLVDRLAGDQGDSLHPDSDLEYVGLIKITYETCKKPTWRRSELARIVTDDAHRRFAADYLVFGGCCRDKVEATPDTGADPWGQRFPRGSGPYGDSRPYKVCATVYVWHVYRWRSPSHYR
jgi:hypothetical protein